MSSLLGKVMSRRWRPAREGGLCAHPLSEDGICNPGRGPLSLEMAERVFQSPERCPGLPTLRLAPKDWSWANISLICKNKREVGWEGDCVVTGDS